MKSIDGQSFQKEHDRMEILDVGCGFRRGVHTKRGTIGIDLYRGLADVVADAHYLPFRDSSFEMCIVQDVLEHLDNPLKSLTEVSRVLKGRGLIKIRVPTESRLRADPWVRLLNLDLRGILRHFRLRKSERHKWQFSEKSLRQKLAEENFEVSTTEYVSMPIIYGRKGRILTKLGFVRHPHFVIYGKKGKKN